MGPNWERLSLFMAMVQWEPPAAGSCCTIAKWDKFAKCGGECLESLCQPRGNSGTRARPRSPCSALLPQQPWASSFLGSPLDTFAGHTDTQNPLKL